MPSSSSDDASILHLTLGDGRPATLRLAYASTILSIDDELVSSWDLAGRPYALVRETGTYRRGLDGGLLHKREATAEAPRLRRRLEAAEGEAVVEAARVEAALALAALSSRGTSVCPVPRDSPVTPRSPAMQCDEGSAISADPSGTSPRGSLGMTSSPAGEAMSRLRLVAAMDDDALRDDAARFLAASGPVGILPPDQYLALVVRVTEGCSWNACAFCRLYRDVPFRAKRPGELLAHVAALRAYFGNSIALRRSVFLGDANALCLAHDRLLPLVEIVARELPGAPLFSFVDAWTGHRKAAAEWRDCSGLGLRRVYLGLETGDPGLLAWLGKPGSPRDAVDLVASLHEAGIAAGVIVLLGAGGERFAAAHQQGTAAVLSAMRLGPDDLVYFSEYADEPDSAYGGGASAALDVEPLSPVRNAESRRAILDGFRPADPARRPRTATYDIREFVY